LPVFKQIELDQSLDFCLNVRILPRDEQYATLKDEEITWEYVYKEVFQYYAMIYPIMSTILPWSSRDGAGDEARVREFATLIRVLVDEQNRRSPLYMPTTRELSRGKRALVRRWCDLQLKAPHDPSPPKNSR
jgi:hypothetical protein